MKRLVPVLLLGIVLATRVWALSADEQMRFADGIYLRGFYETALTEYIALIRDNPGSPHEVAALYRIGECYRQLGNQAGAERFYKRVAQEFPQSPQAPRAELRRAEIAIA
ncbi:MAG TPA: tetratricopeptide repeat protein, partial [Kiritimatiellia bacterium]|nr:tetratricopeptide repeat protein [Kiritimatiellia bacterium]